MARAFERKVRKVGKGGGQGRGKKLSQETRVGLGLAIEHGEAMPVSMQAVSEGFSIEQDEAMPILMRAVGDTVVANQTAPFGALTLAGAGGFKPATEAGSTVDLIAVTDQTGATRTWSISSGRLVANGTPAVDNTVVITCSHAGGSVALTILTEADTYSVLADSTGNEVEFDAALTAIGTAGGKTVKFRSGDHYAQGGVTTSTDFVLSQRSFVSEVVATSHDNSNRTRIIGIRPGVGRIRFNTPTNIKLYQIDLYHIITVGTNLINDPGLTLYGETDGLVFEDMRIYSNLLDLPLVDGQVLGLWPITFAAGYSNVGAGLTVRDCWFSGHARSFQFSSTGGFVFENNLCRDWTADGMVGDGSDGVFRWNDIHSPYVAPDSTTHMDCIQWTGGGTIDFDNNTIDGNRLMCLRSDGIDHKKTTQGTFCNPGSQVNNAVCRDWFVRANLAYTRHSNCIYIKNPVRALVSQNTLMEDGTRGTEGSSPVISFPEDQPKEALVGNEIYDNAVAAFSAGYIDDNNVITTEGVNYASLFDGDGGIFTTNTIAGLMVIASAKTGGGLATPTPKVGVLGHGYAEFGSAAGTAGRTYWWDAPRINTPTLAAIADLTGQATSTLVESAWGGISAIVNSEGGAATNGVLVTIAGGEYRSADDGAGTNATAWGSTKAIVANGKFLQYRTTTSASAATAVVVTVQVGSLTDIWTVTTT